MNEGGTIQGWTAPDTWLCSGYQLGSLKEGKYTLDEMYAQLLAEANTMTLVFRFVGFLVLWVGICLATGPLSIIADCVPFIGPYLGDAVERVICVASCFPATGIAIVVIGICWVAFRPAIGIPMVLLSCLAAASYAYWKHQKQEEKAQDGETQDGKKAQDGEPSVFGKVQQWIKV
eukprot:gnl/MRDRNA2_/MRDRNA2_420768_c0_seq1.p1 gnl/MRDRNA2_/MRDRNA2_420768_c0~~gnl/MRDRNA2_/MRDRNA2_420768_c0_seq1.p1  ORF type:complete len:175 (-),score=19.67 gnl/MRDRNA2_/MRDRNA2_420768_c0_seq1:56-580(-)